MNGRNARVCAVRRYLGDQPEYIRERLSGLNAVSIIAQPSGRATTVRASLNCAARVSKIRMRKSVHVRRQNAKVASSSRIYRQVRARVCVCVWGGGGWVGGCEWVCVCVCKQIVGQFVLAGVTESNADVHKVIRLFIHRLASRQCWQRTLTRAHK